MGVNTPTFGRRDIHGLVEYKEGTARAVMSTDYTALKPEVGTQQATEQLQIQAPGN